jgi:hypothetical protein
MGQKGERDCGEAWGMEHGGRSETKRSSGHWAMPLEVAGALRLRLEAEESLWIEE